MSPCGSACASTARRTSPSVTTPASVPSSPTTQAMPRRARVISASTSRIGLSSRTAGRSSPRRMAPSTRRARRNRPPPGCRSAKSSGLKPFSTSTVIARASPSASAAVVLAVGTRFIGQASSETEQSSTTVAARASVDDVLPVIAMSVAPRRFSVSSRRVSSSVSPLCDRAITTSSRWIMPRSPCTASAGCTKYAGEPVLDSVAAILRQTMPDLPMPVRITRPRQSRTSATAVVNRSSSRSASARTASASVTSTLRARDRSVMRGGRSGEWRRACAAAVRAAPAAGHWRRRSSPSTGRRGLP